jgi:hypothetical protein
MLRHLRSLTEARTQILIQSPQRTAIPPQLAPPELQQSMCGARSRVTIILQLADTQRILRRTIWRKAILHRPGKRYIRIVRNRRQNTRPKSPGHVMRQNCICHFWSGIAISGVDVVRLDPTNSRNYLDGSDTVRDRASPPVRRAKWAVRKGERYGKTC